jgi:hypothetical protein
LGFLQNILLAGRSRDPAAYGLPLSLLGVIGENKVMDTLVKVEHSYPYIGIHLLETFFPGKLRPDEEEIWAQVKESAQQRADGKA